VVGQEIDPRLARPGVEIRPIESFAAKSVDVVTAIEVLEVVEDDAAFLRELARIARHALVVTTPNWAVCRCRWPFHRREYAFGEFMERLRPLGAARFFKGDAPGTRIGEIRWPDAYRAWCGLRGF